MYQSIPVVPFPPPPRPCAFAHFSIPRVGHLKFYPCPGVGHLPTPGTNPRAFDIFVRFWSRMKYMDFKAIQDDHFRENLLRFWPFDKYG